MAIYISGTLSAVLFSYFATHIGSSQKISAIEKKIWRKLFAILSFVPLTFIMAVRYNVGTDFSAYWNMYRSTPRKNIEKGFVAFIDICKVFSSNPQFMFFLASIIICGCYFITFYRESENPPYSILIFVLCNDYFIAMSGLRQYMATAIMLLAVPDIKKHNWKKVFCFLIVAALFHKSIIIYVVLCLIYIINIPPLVSGGIVLCTYLVSNILSDFVIPLLLRLNFYAAYFEASSFFSNREGKFDITYMIIFLCFFVLLCYEYKSVKKSEKLKLMYSAVILSLLILSLSAVLPSNVRRLTWHMNSLLAIYIPTATRELPKKSLRQLMNSAIIGSYIGVTTIYLLMDIHSVLPYQTFWKSN